MMSLCVNRSFMQVSRKPFTCCIFQLWKTSLSAIPASRPSLSAQIGALLKKKTQAHFRPKSAAHRIFMLCFPWFKVFRDVIKVCLWGDCCGTLRYHEDNPFALLAPTLVNTGLCTDALQKKKWSCSSITMQDNTTCFLPTAAPLGDMISV